MSTVYSAAGRQLLIHDREEWQLASRPVTGPTPTPDLVHHHVIHWPGSSPGWKPPSDVAAHLRWAHDLYLIDKGFSYGYGFVIGPNSIDWTTDPVVTDIWEVRGFNIRIASNDGDIGVYGQYSSPNFNGRSISAQFMASVAYPPTDDQILQMRYLVAIADERYDETLAVIPHRTSDITTCPGDHIASLIPIITVRPTTPPPPPQPEPEPTPQPVPELSAQVAAAVNQEEVMERAAIRAANGSFWLGDGKKRRHIGPHPTNPEDPHESKLAIAGGKIDAQTAKIVFSWSEVSRVDDVFLDKYVGVWDGVS